MKVHVYQVDEGSFSVLVIPSLGKGRAPVLLQNVTSENLVAGVLPVIEDARRPKGGQLALPGA